MRTCDRCGSGNNTEHVYEIEIHNEDVFDLCKKCYKEWHKLLKWFIENEEDK